MTRSQILSGQCVLVTGATGAIGRAIARALAAEGARVALHCGRNHAAAETLLAEIGGQGAIFAADLADPAAPQDLWDRVAAWAGRVTGLVNNAGIRSEVAVDAPMNQWQEVV